MKDIEKQLFKNICSFKSKHFDETLLAFATPTVLGQLFFNRMQGVAYITLRQHGMLGRVNREFRNSLKGAYELNLQKNRSYSKCIQDLTEILSTCTCQYAMLKGAYLCCYYPAGYRTANDIDLLVLPESVTEIGVALAGAGFKQGNIRNGEFVPATRKEIIESKMMRGETVPYIKEVGLPGMKYLEVDLNFSLDYKSGDTGILKEILARVSTKKVGDVEIQTLNDCDFFIHLCSHLYKEATTLPWVEMMRDMTLYKYCDIYMLLADMTENAIKMLFERSDELTMSKVCAFTILQTAELFDVSNKYAVEMAKHVLRSDPDFLHLVISPQTKQSFIYTERNIFERFFAENRRELLEEI